MGKNTVDSQIHYEDIFGVGFANGGNMHVYHTICVMLLLNR